MFSTIKNKIKGIVYLIITVVITVRIIVVYWYISNKHLPKSANVYIF